MARKKSIKVQCRSFQDKIIGIDEFLNNSIENLTDQQISWSFEYALIKMYREFEELILNCLIASINQDTKGTISKRTGRDFPKNIKKEVCEYIILKDGYFNFRGRDGLIRELKKYLPDDHFLITIIKKNKYKDTIDQLVSLRNFAAHNSKKAKTSVLKTLDIKRISSSGSWLKTDNRFNKVADRLIDIGDEIKDECNF